MKYFLLTCLFVSSQAMAIDFHKVTGSFEVVEKNTESASNNDLAFGSFDTAQDKSRAPASASEDKVEKSSSFNEITGTFK